MANTAAVPENTGDERRFDAGHMAWGIMLVAFAVFCFLCVISGIGLNYFLFQSTVPMQTRVIVGRGTVTWTDATLISQATRTQVDIFSSAVISTDTISQATLSVVDQYHDQPVTTITLKSDASIDLNQVARPRFDWSSARYDILMDNVRGEFDVIIPRDLGRDTWVTLRTPENAIIRIIRPGQYTVRNIGGQIQVTNYAGEAMITMGGENPNYAVPPGQRGTMQISDGMYAMQPARTNWLGSMTFEPSNVVDSAIGGTPDQQVWGCNNQQANPPSGYFALTDIDRLTALRMERGGGAESHAETSCIQYLAGASGQQGRDISGYSYLGVRATFKIVGHSLSVCGSDGSECPLMLRMEYVPMNGGVDWWIHGFFTRILAGYDNPIRCDTCTQDHEIVNEGVWYTYESGNLLSLIPEEQRPRSILNFRFYASGHEWDVYVSEMALLVGNTNSIPSG